MLNFYDYLIEAAGKPLSSNTGSIKTRGHIVRYIMPYLSSQNKKQSVHELNGFLTDSDIQKTKQIGL